MNEFALQNRTESFVERRWHDLISASRRYDSAVLGRMGWMAVAGLTLAALAGWELRAR